jgi:hypothetical protein
MGQCSVSRLWHSFVIYQSLLLPPLLMHKRYAQCRGTESVLRTLAHLLAAQSRAAPKQAKEPKIPKTNR